MRCRHCNSPDTHLLIDLGSAPPSNTYLSSLDLDWEELYFPLAVMVCHECWLIQTTNVVSPRELFSPDYAYFSSVSSTWQIHVQEYVKSIVNRQSLDKESLVVEIGSNDGTLLEHFIPLGIPCLGIEPTISTSSAAIQKGIPVLQKFFCKELVGEIIERHGKPSLIIGNNVYAHTPNINNFTAGLKNLLNPHGSITLEFPHSQMMLDGVQFDTIYHEHFSYLSLYTVSQIFAGHGLRVYDVEKIPTHGGSLRIYACHQDSPRRESDAVSDLLNEEKASGMREPNTYLTFARKAHNVKTELQKFLSEQIRIGKKIVGYGAAAKGSTLLNFSKVTPDLIPYICDASPAKQGKFMPGSHIPILAPDIIADDKPDFIILLPWNISEELTSQLSFIREWGGKFVIAIPEVKVF